MSHPDVNMLTWRIHVCMQVLNAIAMEFICELDNQLKGFFFDFLKDEDVMERFCLLFYQKAGCCTLAASLIKAASSFAY